MLRVRARCTSNPLQLLSSSRSISSSSKSLPTGRTNARTTLFVCGCPRGRLRLASLSLDVASESRPDESSNCVLTERSDLVNLLFDLIIVIAAASHGGAATVRHTTGARALWPANGDLRRQVHDGSFPFRLTLMTSTEHRSHKRLTACQRQMQSSNNVFFSEARKLVSTKFHVHSIVYTVSYLPIDCKNHLIVTQLLKLNQ